MLSNTSVLHAAADAETARALTSILAEKLQTDPKTQRGRLRKPLDPWNASAHHRGYEGSFVETLEPGKEPRLIEVSFPLEIPDDKSPLLRGWEYTPTGGSNKQVIPRLGNTGKLWDNPMPTHIKIAPSNQEHVHLATVARVKPGGTDKRIVSFGGSRADMVLDDGEC